ncbi:Disease resistance protein [Actinidia chinensis var. chinensis]|uniref:Disease resistance protein n=1 Tax=Actinidia chinensis var. chinensis TaxID=1590841 RepID=A0A2R6R2E7_ACTCC|nr:Disease resistance protein [Actinidia chinensis var. chinensis]
MEEIGFTSGKKMESNVKYLEYHLDKHGFHINLYYASLRLLPRCGLEGVLVKMCGTEEQGRIIGSALRQIVYCFKEGELKVIGISSCPGIANATIVTKALEDLPEIRSMFEVVVSAKVLQFHSISEVQTHIAEQIHRFLVTDILQRLLGTDISLPIDAALKPYKNFLLVLDCPSEGINLHCSSCC